MDVGINRITTREEFDRYFAGDTRREKIFLKKGSTIVGDVHPLAFARAGAYTPVPGGVGPLTIAMVMAHRTRRKAAPRALGIGAWWMLRVGLTGGLGSGKTTVARMFSSLGVQASSADEIGRELMQPGQPVYADIVRLFGDRVVNSDGSLDRKTLAELAFQQNLADALNRIVHPAVIAAEEELMRGVFEQTPAPSPWWNRL